MSYLSPLTSEQWLCLASGALIGAALTLFALYVLSVLRRRRTAMPPYLEHRP